MPLSSTLPSKYQAQHKAQNRVLRWEKSECSVRHFLPFTFGASRKAWNLSQPSVLPSSLPSSSSTRTPGSWVAGGPPLLHDLSLLGRTQQSTKAYRAPLATPTRKASQVGYLVPLQQKEGDPLPFKP